MCRKGDRHRKNRHLTQPSVIITSRGISLWFFLPLYKFEEKMHEEKAVSVFGASMWWLRSPGKGRKTRTGALSFMKQLESEHFRARLDLIWDAIILYPICLLLYLFEPHCLHLQSKAAEGFIEKWSVGVNGWGLSVSAQGDANMPSFPALCNAVWPNCTAVIALFPGVWKPGMRWAFQHHSLLWRIPFFIKNRFFRTICSNYSPPPTPPRLSPPPHLPNPPIRK